MNGLTWEPADSTTEYNAEASETSCRYKCKNNFTWNGSVCEGDSQTFNCAAKPATGTLWNTVSSYEQIWDGTNWIPAESTTEYNAEPSSEHCRFKCDNNYTWNSGTSTCEANTKPFTCDPKPATGTIWNTVDSYTQTWDGGKWVPDDSDTEYNETASSSACRFKCGDNYTWNSLMCVADSKPFNCAEKPGGNTTVWNTVSGYTQTWSGTAWLPAETSTTYNTTASATECRYKCANNYTWNSGSSTCVANTQTANCTGLPSNATWNNVSSINQTWNGTDWAPSSTGTYNITPSSTECRFVCNVNFNWNSPNCVAATQTFSCTAKPGGETTMYNTVSSYTQTWNGSGWLPADDEVTEYNETGSLTSCRYKCANGYTREGENCVINTKTFTCADKPGGTTTVWNTVSSYTQTWNGAAWLPADSTTAYNETGSDTSCRYKCADNHVWDGSSCLACASGWELMNLGTPRCIKAFTDTRTADSARAQCMTFNTGRLVTIRNASENEFVRSKLGANSWIGLMFYYGRSVNPTVNNSSATPIWLGNYGGVAVGDTGSSPSGNRFHYLKFTTKEAALYSASLWGMSDDLDLYLYDANCSSVITKSETYGDELLFATLSANTTYCVRIGYSGYSSAYIVAVNYAAREEEQYKDWVSNGIDMPLYNYHNWNSGEPNNDDELCTQMYTTGFWNDLDCSDSLQYVCERNPGS